MTAVKALLRDYGDEFAKRPRFRLLRNTHAEHNSSQDDFLTSIDDVVDVLEEMPADPSALCHFAGLIAAAGERFSSFPSLDTLLTDARRSINKAIRLDDYPKYHAVLGRILILLGETEEGIDEIRMAIDTEDSARGDYVLRLQGYRQHLLLAEARQYIETASAATLDEMKQQTARDLAAARTQTLSVLGFFAALVALTLTGASIAVERPLEEAAQLIVLLAAALLIGFSGLSLLLDDATGWRRALLMFALGSAAALVALLAVPALVTDGVLRSPAGGPTVSRVVTSAAG
jgi:hypothetical protein